MSDILNSLLEPVLKLRNVKTGFLPHLAISFAHLTSVKFFQIATRHLYKIAYDLKQKVLRQALKILLLSSILVTFSCSKNHKNKEKKEEKQTVESEYIKAFNLLKEKDYTHAAEAFEKIDDDYPFSKWAAKAQTMAAYSRYMEEEYPKLLQVVDDFIRLNPASDYVPYMIYMKGMSYYDQIPAIEISQDNTKQASFVFRELIARFPGSEYAMDATTKLDYIDEHLAGAKMSVGRYQIKNGNYVGAAVSFNEVLDNYRQTNQIPEALFRLAEIYYKIGLKEEAQKAVVELRNRFPNNAWTKLAITKFE